MNPHLQTIGHLERSVDDDRLRRALAARLDRAFKRARLSSAHAAKWLGVSEYDVQYWRHGITVPPLNACTRLAAAFDLDIHWLCTGDTAAASRDYAHAAG
ncbi:XRE family transcriptional regulator [Paraburkholderia sp. MMS20-SJTR3]|uniref:XRE family transcriptional regulator n=1 Tax=Paraburkholderia sejongensis TaxID=2886946 RepID=A0ABS8JR79_9BURK|nr:XRE family transcriptional regulator [Paraburkholderia sp. MMS20-SJTR3]MCC8392411.1 XRE family transcriptional regulator [Paraburkholderia sp. MMS20-SJTR3]